MLQDMRFGLRLLGRSPGFSLVAILTLAVAIGANTAIFTVVNALLLKPMPAAAPRELVRIYSGQNRTSWPNYEDIRERTSGTSGGVFTDVAAHRLLVAGGSMGDAPVRFTGEIASTNFFTLLGVPPALGRTFAPDETRRDLIVLADHVWRARFQADRGILGRVLTFDGRPYEVVGVMPPGFRGVAPPSVRPDFWVPIDTSLQPEAWRNRVSAQVELFARLKPSVTPRQADAAMKIVARQIGAEHPDLPASFAETTVFRLDGIGAFRGMAGTVVPVLVFLGLMSVVSGFVLLIGCANIAGLLMGRAAARRREIAVRLALGAGRRRLTRQLFTESLLLAIIGGAAGVVLATWLSGGVNALAARLPGMATVTFDLQLDARVLAYAIGLSTFTCLLFGLAPAWRASRVALVPSLKEEAGGTTPQRLRQMLVVGQVAVCSLLLVWSGLFARSLGHASRVDPGFDPSGVLLASVMLGQTHDRVRGEQIFVQLQQRVRELPGVEAAGQALVVPLSLTSNEEFYVSADDDPTGASRRKVVGNRLTPGWFETVRIPRLAGRDFTWDDGAGAPLVAMVNETLARQLWNGQAIGRRLRYGTRSMEVIGVVRDSRYWTLGETTAPAVYLPFRQHYIYAMTLHVRTANAAPTIAAIRRAMQQLAPEIAVDVKPMTEAVAAAVLPARIGAAFTGAFGAIAMLLSALGVYGLVAFSVLQRRREIGVRKALGADTRAIVRLVVGGTLTLTAAGLAIGLAIGTVGARALRGFMTGVSPADPATLAAVAFVILLSALLASALPARRAARVDPVVTLRTQ